MSSTSMIFVSPTANQGKVKKGQYLLRAQTSTSSPIPAGNHQSAILSYSGFHGGLLWQDNPKAKKKTQYSFKFDGKKVGKRDNTTKSGSKVKYFRTPTIKGIRTPGSSGGSSGGSSSGSGGGGGGGSSGSGGSSSSNGSSSTSEADAAKYKGSALPDSSSERDYYYNPYIYSRSDPRFKEEKEQSTYYIEGFHEAIAVETYPDGLIHRYFTSMSIDSDKNDIVTTATLNCPYSQQLMKYWIPGQQSCSIYGGTYDKELLFRGRLREVEQNGYEIILTFENAAWKLKQNISSKLYKELEGKEVEYAVKRIFKEAGIKYHVNLTGIPNIENYKLDEDCSVKLNDEMVESVPELTDVIEALQDSEMYNDYAKGTDDTITVSKKYDKHTMQQLDNILSPSKRHTRNKLRTNWTLNQNTNLKTVQHIHSSDELQALSDDLVGDPHYPQEDDTYFDVLSSIASAIDAHMYMVKDTCYFISFPVLFLMDREESGLDEEPLLIDFWMQEDDSFEFDVNQYGFYTTVVVNYRHGSVTAENEDLVRVFGQIPIVYDEKNLTKTQAQAKAQAYLSAHIRDFAMTIKVTVLHTGKIQVGSFVKLRNPQTMSENLYYVYGISTSWDGSSETFKSDLDLRYGPENPDNPEIPEYGVQAVSSSSGGTQNQDTSQPQNIQAAAQQAAGGETDPMEIAIKCVMWVAQHITYDKKTLGAPYANFRRPPECVLAKGLANCCDGSRLAAAMCACLGVYIELVHITGHVFNRYQGRDLDWCKFFYSGKNNRSLVGLNTHTGEGRAELQVSTYPKLPYGSADDWKC